MSFSCSLYAAGLPLPLRPREVYLWNDQCSSSAIPRCPRSFSFGLVGLYVLTAVSSRYMACTVSCMVLGVQEKMGIMNKGVIYALWDYEPQNDDELPMKEGDCMTIVRREDEDEIEWWWARLNDKEGYVPRNLLGVSEPFFFFCFSGLHLQHMEVPRPGVELATAARLHHSHSNVESKRDCAASATYTTACSNAGSLIH